MPCAGVRCIPMQQHDRNPARRRKRQRIPPEQVAEMRALHALGVQQKNIAIRFQCSESAVSLIIRGRRHAAKPE